MAHVHTNREDRIKEMNDEMSAFDKKLYSIFAGYENEVKELEPEQTKMPSFDKWCDMSQSEKDLFRDISND